MNDDKRAQRRKEAASGKIGEIRPANLTEPDSMVGLE